MEEATEHDDGEDRLPSNVLWLAAESCASVSEPSTSSFCCGVEASVGLPGGTPRPSACNIPPRPIVVVDEKRSLLAKKLRLTSGRAQILV